MHVKLSREQEFAILTIDRPEAMNALSFSILRDIGAALDAVHESDARALLITGSGDKAFCAGADIKELRGRSLIGQKQGAEFGQSVFAKLETLPMASVALINGYAFGGGLEFALACTFRIATTNAVMGLPEIKLGLIPGYGGTQRLPRVIGEARALDLIMTGKTVTASDALDFGLISEIVDGPIVEEGMAFARRFTRYSLPALKLARDAVQRAGDTPIHEGLKIEADLSTLAFQTKDAEEGMTAFEEKRKAEFQDE